ncbi:MAG: STAS domain-containing protein [Rhodobacteraceae bacterium]|nr:STAS domain-containing protein [Paracoccaceae bacterium]
MPPWSPSIDRSSPQDNRAMILDLAEVDYINSVGLQAIFAMAKRCEAGNLGFVLCSLSEQIMSVFEVCGFARIIPIFSDRTDALASVRPWPEQAGGVRFLLRRARPGLPAGSPRPFRKTNR